MGENYVCDVCDQGNGYMEVTKQMCNHTICWSCLSKHVTRNHAPMIKCPVSNCERFISDKAIRKVLSDKDTDKYEQLMLGVVEHKIKCLLPDCHYILSCPDKTIQFECPVCSLFNCVMCQASHRFMSCEQYNTSDEAPAICETEEKKATKALQIFRKNINREMFLEMDTVDLLISDTVLDCSTCCRNLAKGDGVVLRCSHVFCKYCLTSHINSSLNIPIECPSDDCKKPLEEREIFMLISAEDRVTYIDKCYSCIKGKFHLHFQCQTPDCTYFVTYSKQPKEVSCPLCLSTNCVLCNSIHNGETCDRYRERIRSTPHGRTLIAIEEQIRRKELMRCPECNQLIKKTRGCDWIRCPCCNVELCWVTQQRRWGPKGPGDISGGCKCGVNGPCHPQCRNCHQAPFFYGRWCIMM